MTPPTPTSHTDPYVLTRWSCDNPECRNRVEEPGATGPNAVAPNLLHGWNLVTIETGYRSRFGDTSPRSYDRLACSLACAQALLAERWRFLGGDEES